MARRTLDAYFTPKWQTRVLLDHVPLAGTVLEPCVGDGSIVNLLRAEPAIKQIYTNDINPLCAADFHVDATKEMPWWGCPLDVDWVVTNPPFNGAFDILRNAYDQVGRVALLLRLSFLEPTKQRGAWLAAHPPKQVIVLPRWSYTGNGKSDSQTTAWMVWNEYEMGQRIAIHPTKGEQ